VVQRVSLQPPAGISIVPGEEASASAESGVLVQIQVKPIEGGQTIQRQVIIQGLALGFQAVASPPVVDVILSGPMPLLQALQPSDVQVILDLFELSEGVHQVTPTVIVPEGLRVQSIVPSTVEVQIVVAKTPTSTPSSFPPPVSSETPTATLSPTLSPTATPIPGIRPGP